MRENIPTRITGLLICLPVLALAGACSNKNPYAQSPTELDVTIAARDLAKGAYLRHCYPSRSVTLGELETYASRAGYSPRQDQIREFSGFESEHGSSGGNGGGGSC